MHYNNDSHFAPIQNLLFFRRHTSTSRMESPISRSVGAQVPEL
ncbi:hypothetical protein [Mucilaginibacter aurantiaciroseus]|nr:hypothetical protein [Mucilaginibacter aurantiaciroseus]